MNYLYLMEFENGAVYIGITNDYKRRIVQHRNCANNNKQQIVYKAMRKYSYRYSVLCMSESRDRISKMEKVLIKGIREADVKCYNMTSGGDNNYEVSDETKEKIRIAATGRKHTEESKIKIGLAGLGRPAWNKGLEKTERKARSNGPVGLNEKEVKLRDFPIEYYETNSTKTNGFRRACRRRDLEFDDFYKIKDPNGQLLNSKGKPTGWKYFWFAKQGGD